MKDVLIKHFMQVSSEISKVFWDLNTQYYEKIAQNNGFWIINMQIRWPN